MLQLVKISQIVLFTFTWAQACCQNLVANGSFEDLNTCYEFKANCSSAAWFAVNSRNQFQIKPVSGTRSLAFTFGNIDDHLLKTFPYTRTLCPLVTGSRYELKIWINCGDFLFEHLDILLSEKDPTRIKKSVKGAPFTFQFSKMDIIEKRPDGWLLLQKIFSVDEEDNFLLFGNLSGNIYSKREQKVAGKYHGDIIYSVDDISLTNIDSTSSKCPQFDEVLAFLYRETHRHTSFVYLDAEQRTPKTREITKNNVFTPGAETKAIRNTDTMVLKGFIFKTGSSQINALYYAVLDSVVRFIQNKKISRIDVKGYTDDIGSDETNKKLSLARAESVKGFILSKSPELKSFLYTHGYGKEFPFIGNTSMENRAKNRRVEIIISEE